MMIVCLKLVVSHILRVVNMTFVRKKSIIVRGMQNNDFLILKINKRFIVNIKQQILYTI